MLIDKLDGRTWTELQLTQVRYKCPAVVHTVMNLPV
jgi:hypothetical protein